MNSDDVMPLILVLLAIKSKASTAEWQRIRDVGAPDLDSALRDVVHTLFPFAHEVMPRSKLPGEPVGRAITTLSNFDRPDVPLMAGALLEQAAKTRVIEAAVT